MIQRGPRRSIDRRLTLAVILTTGVSLLSACVAFVIYDVITLRASMSREANTLAEVVGINSAVALAFRDSEAVAETLAGLSGADSVLAAWIHDGDGVLFASYVRGGSGSAPPPDATPGAEGPRFSPSHLDLFRRIRFGEQDVGSIQLRFSTRALQTRIESYLLIVAVLLVAAAVVAASVAARLKRQISRPLAELVDGSKAIAGGDLAIRVRASTDNELGVLAGIFNSMTEGLRKLVDHVRGSIAEVSEISRGLGESAVRMEDEAGRQQDAIADTAESLEQVGASISEVGSNVEELANFARQTSTSMLDLDTSIADIAENMDQLADSIEATSTGANQVEMEIREVSGGVETLQSATDQALLRLDQLAGSVSGVKQNAEETRELAEDSSREAGEGMTAVIETISGMREIAGSFGELEERVAHLSTRSRSIDEINTVIGDVAAQTTLLSLNAAIIAAQAGEHGKAFSVVADEVERLADRTQRSTREIGALTRALQEDTAAAVAAVEVGSAKVERGVARSNVAGEVLGKILEKSRTSAARVGTISETAMEQSEDLQRVQGAMRQVKAIVEKILDSVREQEQATGSIAEAVRRIRALGTDVRASTDEQRHRSGLVAEASTDVTEKIQHIARAAQAQAASSETIGRALQTFRDVTEEAARRSEVINAMVETLLQRSNRLEREIGRFKTE